MIKFLSIGLVFLCSLSAGAKYWGLICPDLDSAYKFEVMRNKDWSAAWITSLDNNGQVSNKMEAFFKLEEKAIMLNCIEANGLRGITMGLPSGDLTKTSSVMWQPSNYPFSTGSIYTCYDINGITNEIIQKIEVSDTFKQVLQEAKMSLNLKESPEFFYNLVMVNSTKEKTIFIIEVNWATPEKNCTTRLNVSSDFTEISLQSTDEQMFVCDWN